MITQYEIKYFHAFFLEMIERNDDVDVSPQCIEMTNSPVIFTSSDKWLKW